MGKDKRKTGLSYKDGVSEEGVGLAKNFKEIIMPVKHTVRFRIPVDMGKEMVNSYFEEILALKDIPDLKIKKAVLHINSTEEEKQFADGYTHLIEMSFDSQEDVNTYLTHPTHQTLVKRLQENGFLSFSEEGRNISVVDYMKDPSPRDLIEACEKLKDSDLTIDHLHEVEIAVENCIRKLPKKDRIVSFTTFKVAVSTNEYLKDKLQGYLEKIQARIEALSDAEIRHE